MTTYATPIDAMPDALAALVTVASNLTESDKAKPTPCEQYDCHALAEHVLNGQVHLGAMAGNHPEIPADGSLADKIQALGESNIAAWKARGLEGTVPGPGGAEIPAVAGAGIELMELLMHAWDFAQSTGQTVPASDELVAAVTKYTTPIIDGGRASGAIGPAVEPAEGASDLDKLAAFAGRTALI